ncbi:nucleoside triphosphate pyrophosphohydrolase [Phormidium sp. LEGE 05292]|uniref:nucleoside triphosphate pyrophosphohydrolase n=1 Tax=[Phormidium] sp. LEGE 05292 TaxID=767427 RepID=UPI00187E6F77|nr:nucleoside triphosphate pyrophosphohydrolase [Phormidium sp. LEGE 05292]MBE9226196.1 nucleoside triphosphate pyrophosphohydrolase [Phormidium sp. LEGE 05292]
MRKEYDKLVRDKITEIIQQSGLKCETLTLPESEYRQALRQKVVEEAQEVAVADEENLITELADIYEVIDAIIETYGINRELVIAEQMRRRQERGGFQKRIKLLWTE